jgi:hypothetical protein
MTPGDSVETSAAADVADDAAPTAAQNDRTPSLTTSEAKAAAPMPAPSSAAPTPAATMPSAYARSDWPTGRDSAAGPAAPRGTVTAPSSNGYATGNGQPSSANAPGPASGIGGAASGLANSVSAAWQKRNTAPRTMQARKSSKRQAMLTLARVEPWSVMKFSFVASVVAFIILFVAVAVLYMVLAALGVFDSLQHTVSTMTSGQGTEGTNISHWFSASLILGYTAMLGALNIVLITAISTVGSVIYNLIAKTIGGIEVTLRETD